MPCDLNVEHELETEVAVINPKSITMGQLYGCFDPVSHEWTDGVLAVYYSKFASSIKETRKWMVFDGPVDAIWIENMNTVLDDNKKLCLMSGEMRLMTKYMNMIFEPISLEAASPATVSRCGMVYMEPNALGWEPLLESWLKSEQMKPIIESDLVDTADTPLVDVIRNLFYWLVTPACEITNPSIQKGLNVLMDVSNEMKAKTVMHMFSSLLPLDGDAPVPAADSAATGTTKTTTTTATATTASTNATPCSETTRTTLKSISPKDRVAWVECQFLFSVVWSIGSTLGQEGRDKFDEWLRQYVTEDVVPTNITNENEKKYNKKRKLISMFPRKGSVFDFVYKMVGVKNSWLNWETQIERSFEISKSSHFSNIVVPTTHTVQHMYLLQALLTHKRNVLFVGPTGTGKSVYIAAQLKRLAFGFDQNHVTKKENKLSYSTVVSLAFSAQTSANTTQDIIDAKTSKIRKGLYGPATSKRIVSLEKRHGFIFVDDLNMPEKEEYGAQPPLELLRQGLADNGWYDRSDSSFRQMTNISYVAAMVPPGGGRNSITPRLTRHFEVVGVAQMSQTTMEKIFTTILHWYTATVENFCEPIVNISQFLIKATSHVYSECSKQLLPTPSKSHYIFNLRDFGRCVQGIMQIKKSQIEGSTSSPAAVTDDKEDIGDIGESQDTETSTRRSVQKMIRLWAHETLRVFSDRLVDDADREICLNIIQQSSIQHLDLKDAGDLKTCMASRARIDTPAISNGESNNDETKIEIFQFNNDSMNNLIFCDFFKPDAEPKIYDEIYEVEVLRASMKNQLEEYNLVSTKPMDLVLFNYAIQHVARISRVLRTPGGHALLVGVGGSGRQSLTYMAGYMGSFELKQIRITATYSMTDFHDDLKNAMMTAASSDSSGDSDGSSSLIGGTPTIFLLSDTQIQNETMVENISNLLNSGEVPNMMSQEDIAAAVEAVRPSAKADRAYIKELQLASGSTGGRVEPSPSQLFHYWKRRVRAHLHVVLAFSPVGEAFRKRLRQFPSIINCCTIDNFTEWH
jgi:dynein heavy chain